MSVDSAAFAAGEETNKLKKSNMNEILLRMVYNERLVYKIILIVHLSIRNVVLGTDIL